MLAVWFVLIAIAVSPSLHQILHSDSHSSAHHCAVKVLEQGSLMFAGALSLVSAPFSCPTFSPSCR
jgi:hypothetical protein